MTGPIKVLLADDHPLVRSGIHSLLEKVADIEMVGEASNGEEALRLVAERNPDVLLLDMELPDIEGAQVAQQVHQLYPSVKTLVLSAHDDAVYVREALRLGAAGYLSKEEAPEFIIEAIRGVAQGEQGWVSRRIAAQITSWIQDDKPLEARLTLREQEVLRLIVQGKTNQAIANDLNISEKTVEKYIRLIFNKLDVASRVEAAVLAVREGLV
ncbi:MAG: response regulator transcription factor [Chloroflexi bacterium]|nr:response regulator transcription factor [Chloroflexota bacterium]